MVIGVCVTVRRDVEEPNAAEGKKAKMKGGKGKYQGRSSGEKVQLID